MQNHSPREILEKEFRARSEKNGHYSLRAFARDMEISPATLSLLLKGNKGMSDKMALKISARLGLGNTESQIFRYSALALHARSKAARSRAASELKKLNRPNSVPHRPSSLELQVLGSWISYALLSLIEIDGLNHDVATFAKKLGVHPAQVKSTLRELKEIGWLGFKNGHYFQLHQSSETSSDLPSQEIRRLHASFLRKAEEILFYTSPQEREFLNITLSFQESDLPAAKEFLRSCQAEFVRKFYREDTPKNSVRQVSIQLFRLDTKE